MSKTEKIVMITPSILSADFTRLGEEILEVEKEELPLLGRNKGKDLAYYLCIAGISQHLGV